MRVFSPLRPLVSAKMVSGRGWRVAEDEPGQDFGKAEDPRLSSLDERLRQARDTEAARTGVKRRRTRSGAIRQGNRVHLRPDRESRRQCADRLVDRPLVRHRALGADRDAVPRDSGRVQADHSDFRRAPGINRAFVVCRSSERAWRQNGQQDRSDAPVPDRAGVRLALGGGRLRPVVHQFRIVDGGDAGRAVACSCSAA